MPSSKPRGRPFQAGQSGNPGGRPRKDIGAVALEEWRKRNAEAVRDVLTDDEVKDIWQRWIARFRAGDPKALWLVPYVFAQPPKAVEPEQNAADKVTTLEIRRLDKDGDGADPDPAAPV